MSLGVREIRAAGWLALAAALGHAPTGRAQTPDPPAPAARAASRSREAELEERLRRLEARLEAMPDPTYVRKLEADVRRLSTQVERLSARPAAAGPARPPARGGAGAGGEEVVGEGAVSPAAEPPAPRFDMPEPIPDLRARVRFGPGFEIKTEDDEFNLQFHDLTQVDGRFYQQRNQNPVADTFGLARQWFIFSGHITKPVEYYLSIADAFDAFNILDVFLNVNYDRRIQFRAGRFKSPFTYEFYAEPTQGLANGEWSLFFNNFGMDRDVGAMLWGESLFKRVDYAAGIFNSTPNSFVDLSDPKSLIAFFNAAPWRPAEGSPLENFNIGGSVVAGAQQHVPVPVELRTIVPTSGSTVLGVPFLAFNPNALSSGERTLWSLHMAYYYRQLSLIGEWQSGFEDFALVNPPNSRTRLPIESFYVQAAYMLTGERVASRGMVKPRRPFDLRRGRFGPGAWELAARYSTLTLGDQVFSGGLADPNLWTNRLWATDLGVSWYWNQYVRVLFDWQHAEFGQPVYYAPGRLQKTSDLYLIRFQLWF